MTEHLSQQRSLAILNHLLATRLIPGILGCLSLFAVFFLDPNQNNQLDDYNLLFSTHSFHLLEGGIWALAILGFCLAYYHHNYFFLLIGAWILCNLRMGSIILNQEAFWLQLHIPPDSLVYLNQLSIGMYFLLSQQLLQFLLKIPASSKLNRCLNLFAFLFFVSACLPYSEPFSALFYVGLPLALASAIYLSLTRLLNALGRLLIWQALLLTTLVCGLASYVLMLNIDEHLILDNFVAFIFFILCQSVILFWFFEHSRNQNKSYRETRLHLNQQALPFVRVDADGQILYSNQAFKRLSYSLIQHLPLWWDEIFPKQNWKFLARCTKEGKPIEISPLGQNTPGQFYKPQFKLYVKRTPFDFLVSLCPTSVYGDQSILSKTNLQNPILNQKGLEKALQYILTNINSHQPCFLSYLEINQISQVSRSHGHAASEGLLQSIGTKLHDILDNQYAFGRIGNDDFVFVMPHTSAETAYTIAQKLTSALNSEPIQTETRSYKLQAHLGVIELGPDMDEHSALRIAQSACDAARRQQKDFVMYEYDSLEMQYHAEKLTLFQRLENGSTQGLFIEMQPLMSLANPMSSINVEVLLRIRRDNGELIPTYNFIAAAEENGTIATIDKWVFSTTLEWLLSHQEQLSSLQLVTINLSGSSLNNDKFITEFFEILDNYKSVLSRLCVEITEGVALQDLSRTRSFMQQLHSKGVRIALDDFGAGYTSFNYLRELPAHLIKIDGALIRDMLHNNNNIAIVRTIVELAHNLGMTCVAEWVEDAQTLAALNEMRVHYAQGYAISASVSPNTILNSHSILDLIHSPEVRTFIKHTYPTVGAKRETLTP